MERKGREAPFAFASTGRGDLRFRSISGVSSPSGGFHSDTHLHILPQSEPYSGARLATQSAPYHTEAEEEAEDIGIRFMVLNAPLTVSSCEALTVDGI